MAVALRDPSLLANLVSIDNAPVDAALKSDFGKYIRGMRRVEEAGVRKQSEADEILREFEEVRPLPPTPPPQAAPTPNLHRPPRHPQNLPIRQFLLTNLIRSSPSSPQSTLKFRIPLKTLAGALDNMADFPFKDPEEARFNGPTLFVRGTESAYVADEMLPIIGRFFPRFELRDVVAGHWVVSENPGGFRDGELAMECPFGMGLMGRRLIFCVAVEEFLGDKV